MRLMPNEVKNNVENAPLSVARDRVKDSWKVFKRSIYSSLNVKVKNYPDDNNSRLNNFEYQGENSIQSLDCKLKDEQDLAVDAVDENVQSFLRESKNYDDIGDLLDKYRYELCAFNRVKNKLRNGDLISEFSELSSISELSSSDSNDDSQTIITRSISGDLQILQNRLTYSDSQVSPNTISSHNASLSTSSSTISANITPPRQDEFTKLQYNFYDNQNLPPPERATAVLKPLPTVKKAFFLPDMSNDAAGGSSCNIVEQDASLNPSFASSSIDMTSKMKMERTVEMSFTKDNTSELVKTSVQQLSQFDTVKKKPEVFPCSSDSSSDPVRYFMGHSSKDDVTSEDGDRPYMLDSKFHYDRSGDTNPCKSGFQPYSNTTSLKPLNISQSTMAKYPHIFANYLPKQQNPFNSLPNLTAKTEVSQKLPSTQTNFLTDKSTFGRSLSHCSIKSQDYNNEKLNTHLPERKSLHANDVIGLRENFIGDINMIDENYYVIYPGMNGNRLTCGNPPCSKNQEPTEMDRLKFTSCPACFICYCSRTCRHCHWPIHKETCIVGFVNFYVHTFFRRCEKDIHINGYLRKLAHSAYKIFGRGCLTMTFKAPSEIEYDAISPGSELSTQPTYKEFKKILSADQPYRHLHMLCQNIKDYDPDQEFVLDIFVYIGNMNPLDNVHTSVVRSARISVLKLLNPHYGESILSYGIRTFSLPTSFHSDVDTDIETRRYYCKEIAFGLKRYGVHLKSEYPEAYEKLYRYIDQEVLFSPIILYGKRNDRNYKCILYSGELKKSNEYCGEGVFV